MSIMIADTLDRLQTFETDSCVTERPLVERAKRSANATRARLPNKTQWSLNDMLDHARCARTQMEELHRLIASERLEAKGKYDAARLARLGEWSALLCSLALHVAALERLAADARAGIYEPRGEGGEK